MCAYDQRAAVNQDDHHGSGGRRADHRDHRAAQPRQPQALLVEVVIESAKDLRVVILDAVGLDHVNPGEAFLHLGADLAPVPPGPSGCAPSASASALFITANSTTNGTSVASVSRAFIESMKLSA